MVLGTSILPQQARVSINQPTNWTIQNHLNISLHIPWSLSLQNPGKEETEIEIFANLYLLEFEIRFGSIHI